MTLAKSINSLIPPLENGDRLTRGKIERRCYTLRLEDF